MADCAHDGKIHDVVIRGDRIRWCDQCNAVISREKAG